MKRRLHTQVLETIERYSMMQPGDRVGVGVSGGADSVALLRLFAELQPRLGVRLIVLHFHHQLRGADADEDERFVGRLADQLGFEFKPGRGDVAGEARRRGWNLEDSARRLRHQFFASAAEDLGLRRVAVAHTSDDQAETVLAHLLRGTGPAGLAGIYPVAGLMIRPLLEIRREALRDYLSGLRQSWREDATNQDVSRTRAHIRHRLLPHLQQEYEPAVAAHLASLADLVREEECFWQALEQERFEVLAAREPGGGVSVRVADVLSPLPLALNNRGIRRIHSGLAAAPELAVSRRLVRRIYSELRGSRQGLTARHVAEVLRLATKSQSGSRVQLPGVTVERVFDRLLFVPESDSAPSPKREMESIAEPPFEYAIASLRAADSASVDVPEIRRRLRLKVVDWSSAPSETKRGRDTLDFDRIRWPLILRNWRPGDSYRPFQRQRARKLKRMLLEFRVPRRERASWPVLTSAGAVVWARGLPVADEFAPRRGTRAGLVIAEEEI